ncbi:cyclase family protein [Haloterrigena alkaliphila]|uniref:Cyclase family protein n=1 Tax=Haloterrigena alkaliphila TaxID=2816475 RepID=A0A8A2VG69_9EURY|nr:cyclase family protein [Haloterrigena alkaliphila]QSW99657.1 cyclase family protein [Haloterrigena alkaliphila]
MEEHDHDSDAGIDRRNFVRGCGAAAAIAAAGLSVDSVAAMESNLDALLADLPDNWGRWGEDDELGALNLLGSEEAYAGMEAAMKRGPKGIERFTLQTPMTGEAVDALVDEETDAPTRDTGDPMFPGRTPARRDNAADARTAEPYPGGMKFSDDRFVTEFFLHGTTHMDALGHGWYGNEVYNGRDEAVTAAPKEFDRPVPGCVDGEAGNVQETHGHSAVDVSPLADAGVAGRGVLLDVGRACGDDRGWLDLGAEVTLEDMKATAEAQGVELRERDVVLLRTGSIERVADPEAEWDPMNEPGLVFSEDLIRWVHDMEIPMIGADNVAVEKVTQTVGDHTFVLPLHGALLRDLGVSLNEILWLEELASQCADDGIYDFLLTSAPLHVERATGGPVNPVVLKATKPKKKRY